MLLRSQANPPMTSLEAVSKLPQLLLVKQVMGSVRERAKQPRQKARFRGWRHSRFCCLCQMFTDNLPCVDIRLQEGISAIAKIPKYNVLGCRRVSDAFQIPCSYKVLSQQTEAEGQGRSPIAEYCHA